MSAQHALDHPLLARILVAACGVAVVCRVARRLPRVAMELALGTIR